MQKKEQFRKVKYRRGKDMGEGFGAKVEKKQTEEERECGAKRTREGESKSKRRKILTRKRAEGSNKSLKNALRKRGGADEAG